MTRDEIREILTRSHPTDLMKKYCSGMVPFLEMSPSEQEELIDAECYIDNHAPREVDDA